MTVTANVPCSKTAYTAVSTAGQANVTMNARGAGRGRLIVATSQPAPEATTYFTVEEASYPISLSGLGASDVVYFMPDKSMTMEVIRG